jgi:hypothetical protein
MNRRPRNEWFAAARLFLVITARLFLVITGVITIAELLIAGPNHWLVGTWVFWGAR